MKKGNVKFWNASKGFGYIREEETGKEFYTYIKLLQPGVKSLRDGCRVEFETKENCGPGKDQTHAINVKVVN